MLGEVLGNYRVLRKLGKGGMGTVYLAEHRVIKRKVAIKVLMPEFSRQKDIAERFFREAHITGALLHPGIVQVLDFGKHTDGSAYLVMEYLRGEPLDRRLKRERKLPVGHALRIAHHCASALAAAHAAGVVHRDLKPGNVFLVPDPQVEGGERAKILDFGIAKLTDQSLSLYKTRTGNMVGTPVYMSPEQCRGTGEIDHRSDIYALGCLLFRMICARPPFVARGMGEIIACHLREPPPSPREFEPSIPPDLEDVILRMLAKSPDDRFANMGELAAKLKSLGRLRSIPPLNEREERKLVGSVMSEAVGSGHPEAPGGELRGKPEGEIDGEPEDEPEDAPEDAIDDEPEDDIDSEPDDEPGNALSPVIDAAEQPDSQVDKITVTGARARSRRAQSSHHDGWSAPAGMATRRLRTAGDHSHADDHAMPLPSETTLGSVASQKLPRGSRRKSIAAVLAAVISAALTVLLVRHFDSDQLAEPRPAWTLAEEEQAQVSQDGPGSQRVPGSGMTRKPGEQPRLSVTPLTAEELADQPDTTPGHITVRIESQPPGAAVYLGQQKLGETPFDYTAVSMSGPVTLRLELHGYRTTSITFPGDRSNTIRLALVARPKERSSLKGKQTTREQPLDAELLSR